MTPARWARIKKLFSEALEVPEDQRAAYLMVQAADDESLIADVQSLLSSHDQSGDFLDAVPGPLRAAAFSAPRNPSRVGERIGAYRIVGVLGTGGMGDVFKAVRDDDQYRAEVAIKLMRADVRSSLTEQRFKTERQILAGLDHRNIARLLDGGTTVTGLPYVVMELVSGEPIDHYCDTHELSLRDRVLLFLQVCSAVSYAHQHLVVHRDLKPNNIFVSTDGSVKLLDFGIAKLLEPNPATAETDATVTQMRAMTLDYASPEQVSGGTVTTVSDVYSLGVVLYRLLTGASPYGARINDAQRLAAIMSDTTPTRPSHVQRKIDADLDNILLMALRKEPQRRYGSAEQFGNDLRNFLGGLPVQARGNALRYRFGKFLRRRKVEIAAGLLVAASLIGGLGFALREARVAEQQRQVAERHFNSVRKLANKLLFDIHDEIQKVPGSTKSRELLVKTSLEYLDSLYQGASSDRALQEELAAAYKKVGDIQGDQLGSNIGDFKGALVSYQRSVSLLEALIAADPTNQRVAVSLARTYVQQAGLLMATAGAAPAAKPIERAMHLAETNPAGFTDDFDRMAILGNGYGTQADVLGALGRAAEARIALDKMVGACEDFARAHPGEERSYLGLSAAYSNSAVIGSTNMSMEDAFKRSEPLLRKALQADEKLVSMSNDSMKRRRSLAETRFNLADAYNNHGDYPQALALLALASPVLAERTSDADDAAAQYESAMVDTALARSLFRVGRVEEARVMFVKSVRIMDELSRRESTLAIDFTRAQAGVWLGELYEHLANTPKLGAAARLAYRRQAQDSLRHGVELAKKVNASIKLEGFNRKVLDDGEAALARMGTLPIS